MKFLKQEIKVYILFYVIIGLVQNAFLDTGDIKYSTVDREIGRKEYTWPMWYDSTISKIYSINQISLFVKLIYNHWQSHFTEKLQMTSLYITYTQ